MNHINKLFMFIVVVVLTTMLVACGSDKEKQSSAPSDMDKNELILAIGGESDEGFDPTTGWGQYGSPLFQSTLLKYDKDFNVQLDLAEDYSVSDDGLEWTIKIRDGVKFSDGEELTAEDVVFTYQTAESSGSVIDLSNMKKVENSDSHTVIFTLKKPASTFINLLTTIGVVPEHAYDDSYSQNPIGSGPFQLVQWNKGQQLIVEENPYYYGEKPYFKKLTFLFLAEDAAFAAAKSGQADVVSVPSTFAKEKIPGMHLIKLRSADNRGIMFPFVPAGEETKEGYPIGNDVTSDPVIRKAINFAVDRQALVDGVLDGYGTPAYTVADQLPWWNPETVIKDNNMDSAKQMLDEAGWKENEQGVREKDGVQASFNLLYPAGDQIRQSLSIAFADMIKPLGLQVKTEGQSWNELEKTMHANPVMMGWGSHNPLEMYNIYSGDTRGEGYYNSNYYFNPTVDAYMEKAMRATSQEDANTYWKKAQWMGKQDSLPKEMLHGLG
ncbi:ABC transporter substrate-binding protein [Virgibacillus halodenitrificans]|uniref:ABC transporter substrate-binding protein n=1 Tax=Virgibacillus halodenitrificans TaxID=1482 RepID=UPI000A70ED5C